MSFMPTSSGTGGLMRGFLGLGGSRQSRLTGPVNYDAERARDPSLLFARQIMRGTGNPDGTTSGAVRDAVERILGAYLAKEAENAFTEKENAANAQYRDIWSGDYAGIHDRAAAYGDTLDPKVAAALSEVKMREGMMEPERRFRQEQADRQQANADRQYALQEWTARENAAFRRQQAAENAAARRARAEDDARGLWEVTPDGKALFNRRQGTFKPVPPEWAEAAGSKSGTQMFAPRNIQFELPDGSIETAEIPENVKPSANKKNEDMAGTLIANALDEQNVGKAKKLARDVLLARKSIQDGLYTGTGGKAIVQPIRELLSSAGLTDGTSTAGAEALQRVMSEETLKILAMQKGAQSEKDAERVEQTTAGLNKSKASNEAGLDAIEDVLATSDLFRRYVDAALAAGHAPSYALLQEARRYAAKKRGKKQSDTPAAQPEGGNRPPLGSFGG